MVTTSKAIEHLKVWLDRAREHASATAKMIELDEHSLLQERQHLAELQNDIASAELALSILEGGAAPS